MNTEKYIGFRITEELFDYFKMYCLVNKTKMTKELIKFIESLQIIEELNAQGS